MTDTLGRTPTYTDGTPVRFGDPIRYRQAAGGLLPRNEEWKTGTAVLNTNITRSWQGNLVMLSPTGRKYNLIGHEIERVLTEDDF